MKKERKIGFLYSIKLWTTIKKKKTTQGPIANLLVRIKMDHNDQTALKTK